MITRTTIIALALAATPIAIAAPAGAQTVATHSKTVTTTTKPKVGATTVQRNSNGTFKSKTVDAHGNMATHTTTTGKKITYDCSKAGNKTKAACKGK